MGDVPDEVDPALVVVFDLAGSVKDFHRAIAHVEGLEFLSEMLGDQADPDDDFHMVDRETGRTDKKVPHALYMVMSNALALNELVRLFSMWQDDHTISFSHGLGRFKLAFEQLAAIRPWGPEDRIRESGLRDQWEETLAVVGQSVSLVRVEVELWYRSSSADRSEAESRVREIVTQSGGRSIDRAELAPINYHALLVELPIQQVQNLVERGAAAVQLLVLDDVMFVSPFVPMTVAAPAIDPQFEVSITAPRASSALPRIALLDGLPFQNHDALAGRLLIDDPDALGQDYPVAARHHGTAMASLIIHGDLSTDERPLDRPLYVRPILQPHEFRTDVEQSVPDRLFTDLLHLAIRRIAEGDAGRPAAAPSVRIVNLSIGAQSRALSRRMSPAGRLLDWLANSYNLLFVVSAGNYLHPLILPVDSIADVATATAAATKSAYESSRRRGILPPGDAMNALTVGATHEDGLADFVVPDTVWDITSPRGPSHFGATGPGVDRSVKPDVHHLGGRALYSRPILTGDEESVSVEMARTTVSGPGLQVAAPASAGATNRTIFTVGTSNATALVTREASKLFDVLERSVQDPNDPPEPNSQYHPLLVRALLAHASSWGDWGSRLRADLNLDGADARRRLTALLGYGQIDPLRLGVGATNNAVLIAGESIARDERHTYNLPLPTSLRAKAEWHRFTITLAYMAPTVGQLTRYRAAKVFFATPNFQLAGGDRIEAEHTAVRRGSLQHEVIEGSRAMVFGDNDSFPVHVDCMDDAQRLPAGQTIRYALVVSVETAEETSTTIHNEVRDRLRQQVRDRTRERAQS